MNKRKLSIGQVIEIRRRANNGAIYNELARLCDVNSMTISNIVYGINYPDVGGIIQKKKARGFNGNVGRRYPIENIKPLPIINSFADGLTDLAAGTAGEHLVCADLILMGYKAFRSEQVCAYDAVVDLGGKLIRIQVKTARKSRVIPQLKSRNAAYIFHVKKSGKGGRKRYAKTDFDLLALVALDAGRIAYLPPSKAVSTVNIRSHNYAGAIAFQKGRTFDNLTFSSALAEISHAR